MTSVRRRAAPFLAVAALLLGGVAVPTAADAAAVVPGEFFFIQTPDRQNYYLYAADATTGARRRVTTQQAMGRPSVSPSGQKIVYSGPLYNDDTLGRFGLYVINRDGTGLRRLTAPAIAHLDPVWSPGGSAIAYTNDPRGNSEASCCNIAIINADGSNPRNVPNTSYGSFPAWSPDGRRLAFIKPDGLYVVYTNGTGLRRVATGRITTPEWSPDGRSIAYAQRTSETSSSLRVVPAAGGTATTRWTPSSGHVESPVWAVDGSTLYVSHFRGWGDWARTRSSIIRVVGTAAAVQLDPGSHLYYLDYSSGIPAPGRTGVGLVRASGTSLTWRQTNLPARPSTEPTAYTRGRVGDIPLVGDWDGNGADTAAVVRPTADDRLAWYFGGRTTPSFIWGSKGDRVVSGDWDGDGLETGGLIKVVDGRLRWYFVNDNVAPRTEWALTYGLAGDKPVAGDWNRDGISGIGVARPADAGVRWLLDNSARVHAVAYDFTYGASSDRVVVGDWDGDGDDNVGVTRTNPDTGALRWLLRTSHSTGTPTYRFDWGRPTDQPVAGDWDGR